jgi:hypothetical protein
MQDETCSRLSLEAGEPLAGSAAAETELWVVLEHGGTWGPKGLDDSGLPEGVVKHIGAFAKAFPRARVQLIRRPDRDFAQRALFLARGTPGATALWGTSLAQVEDCIAIDLAAWAQGGEPLGCARVDTPLHLVCVHGRRDRCCAQRGMPVYNAFAEQLPSDAVWQTSHLGGHRFAATMVVLPEGICYGRVEASEAGAIIAAHASGQLYAPERMRGRCALASEAQAAEVALREQLAERGLDAIRWLGSDKGDDVVTVRLLHVPSAEEHSVRVTKRTLPAFPQSCGASHRPSQTLVALTLR